MTEGSLKVGVVGLGKMGLLHAGVLSVLPGVDVVGLCEKSDLLRRFLRKVFKGVCVVDDLEKFSALSLDAVYVTTPIPSHFPVVRAVYSKKVASNLFVEKTLAWRAEEAEELCELAYGLGGVNMVGYLRRFGVTFRKAKEMLVEEAVGHVSSFRGYAYSSDFLGSEKASEKASSRGGVLRELGCHAVDLALWFFGDLQVGFAEIRSHGEDSVHFRARNSSGLEGEFDVSWCVEGYRMAEVGFSISGSKGVMKVNDSKLEVRLNSGKSSTWYRHDLDDSVPFWLGLPEYYREDLHFVRSVLEGCAAEPSFCTASKVDKIVEQILRSVVESG